MSLQCFCSGTAVCIVLEECEVWGRGGYLENRREVDYINYINSVNSVTFLCFCNICHIGGE